MILHLWEGANRYLAAKWAENGFNPETTASKALEDAAVLYERAERIRKQTQFGSNNQSERYRNEKSKPTHQNDGKPNTNRRTDNSRNNNKKPANSWQPKSSAP